MKNLFENFKSKEFNTKNLKLMLKRAFEKYRGANSSFWVTSLSFYTILAIVPILAILVSLGSWFGAKDYIINQIKDIAPLKSDTLELLTDFSNNLLMDARSNVLAGVGFIFLGSTFIKMFSLIEDAFNQIWHIKKSRSLIRKISDYISFFIFLPLVFITLNGISLFFLAKIKDIGFLYYIIKNILPLFSMTIFFTAVFLVMPNTTVKVFPALVASIIVSVAFLMFQYIFILLQFLLIGYSTVYGSFSVIFIFIIWIRIFWFIVILGVHICYLIQNANFDINIENDGINISFNSKLYITFKVLEEMVNRYLNNEPPVNIEELRKITTSSPFLIGNILDELIRGGYIFISLDYSEKVFCLTKNIDEIYLKERYDFIANTGEEIFILLQFLLIGYSTVYGSFSVIFIFIIWIRIFWFIVILGVHISYLIQNANFDINIENDNINISFNSKLYITLKVLEEIIKRYLNNQSPPNMSDLRKVTTSSPFLIGNVLDDLIRAGYILSSRDYSEKVFCIAKNIEDISLKEIYDFIANTGEEIYILQDGKITDNIEKIIIDRDYDRTLKSLGGESAEEN